MYTELARQRTMVTEHQQRLDRHEDELAALTDDMISVKELLAIMGEIPEPRISIHQANQIQALVSKIHDATHIHQATIFAAFKRQWKLPRYDELPATQFDAALEWLRQWGRARLSKKS